MTMNRKLETSRSAHRRATLGAQRATGWWRRFGILCLQLCLVWAATVMWSPAQDEQDSKNSVTFTTLFNLDVNGTSFLNPALVQGTDGNLYGTSGSGGTGADCPFGVGQCGMIFKMTPSGTLTTLYSFCAETNCADGGGPLAGLIVGTDGNLYGNTFLGGSGTACTSSFGCGTLFKITPSGTLTTLYSFCSQPSCTDGDYSVVPDGTGALIQASDGNFYGTNSGGGANGGGTVFRITPEGTLTTLYTFCSQTNCADGLFPTGSLIQATDGNFYGTTQGGGAYGFGTVFTITPEGTLTTLYSFCSQANCSDGSTPYAGLVQGADRNFYGVTSGDFTNGSGTVFKITPEGALTTLYSFCSQTDCADGRFPGGLVRATDGNLYGNTDFGANSACNVFGLVGCGTVFKISPEGTLTTLHSFDGTDGDVGGSLGTAQASVVQATDGTFYGTTGGGGSFGGGTIFNLSVGLDPFVETLPVAGKVGTSVTILGTDLTGANSVRFNGKAAAFTVVSATEITANVPADGKTGFVTVHTPSGTLKSNVKFQVLP